MQGHVFSNESAGHDALLPFQSNNEAGTKKALVSRGPDGTDAKAEDFEQSSNFNNTRL